MSYRRVVTGHDEAGRSCVVVDEIVTDWVAENGLQRATLWVQDPAELVEPARRAAAGSPPAYAVPRGGSRAIIARIPPWAELQRQRASSPVEHISDDGFHTTPTLDYVHILEGAVSMRLDTGSVELTAGDVVVQRATRHAWHSPAGVTMLGIAIDAAGG